MSKIISKLQSLASVDVDDIEQETGNGKSNEVVSKLHERETEGLEAVAVA